MKNKKELTFEPIEHKYTLGDKEFISATEFIDRFHAPFDADKVSGFLVMLDKKKGIKSTKVGYKKKWKASRDYGNKVHDEIDEYLTSLGETELTENDSVNAVKWTISKLQDDCTLMPEKKVYTEKYGIAGTADLIVEKDGKIFLADWKTCEKLTDYAKKKMKKPITHIPDSKLHKYYLQLNLYKYILDTEYDVLVNDMVIVHISQGELKEINVPDMQEDIKIMLDYYMEEK